MLRNSIVCGAAGLVVVMIACGSARAGGDDEKKSPPKSTGKSLEGLLKEAKIEYTRHEDGDLALFKIPVEIEGETTMVYAREHALGRTKDAELKIVYMTCTVAPIKKDFKAPPAMLKRAAEMNEELLIGNVSVGKTVISYNTSFFLRTADPEVVVLHLIFSHASRLKCRKELQPFLEE